MLMHAGHEVVAGVRDAKSWGHNQNRLDSITAKRIINQSNK